jgi:hypothetical protein
VRVDRKRPSRSGEWTKKPPPAEWHRRGGVVVLRGGPRHRWWYFADDLDRLRAALERVGRHLPYAATQLDEEHPTFATFGRVYRWTGQQEHDMPAASPTRRTA